MWRTPRVLAIDDRGVTLLAAIDRPVDVLVDGRRVWTFWTLRDTSRVGVPVVRRVPWPRPLSRYLDGRARFTLRDPATGEVFLERELSLGSGEGRIDIRTEEGVELGIDKSGKLVPTFAGKSDADIAALLDATQAVLDALRGVGVEPFLAYGTLLGAVREGRVLGHDSDADLGYVSRFTAPVDVTLESFRIQRALAEQGWVTSRYSGAAFKVSVRQASATIGLDVFGGFLGEGRLYLLGEVGTEFEEEWLRPLGSCELGGRPMPVPARPEKLLEATYGPGWRVPDPAFRFTTPARTVRAFDAWFRGTQPGQRFWERRANATLDHPLRGPSPLAEEAARYAAALGAEVLEVGPFRGSDSLWLARQGFRVTAYDYVPRSTTVAQEQAAAEQLSLEVRHLNLTEWRSTLAEGARLAHDPRPRVVVTRHVLDATSDAGRESFARWCSMVLREGGAVLAEFHVLDDDRPDEEEPHEWMVSRVRLEQVTTLLTKAGATRIEVSRLPNRKRATVRLVGEWARAAEDPAAGIEHGGAAGAGATGGRPRG